jgi:flagellar biosynthesis/type III secretory pathway protein FliH
VTSPVQVIQPPNPLRAKLGAGISADAIARAEEALQAMSAQFDTWLQDEMDKLEAARGAIQAEGYTATTAEGLYFRAHDLKGLGSTYQYPLVTRLAASLCRMLDKPEQRMAAPMALVDAHVEAIRAVVRDRIKTDEHPVGRALAEELERRVSELGA